MAGLHVFDPYVGAANAWLRSLMEDLGLSSEESSRGVHALRAGLHAIRDRLPAAEVVDLAAQLPTLVRGIYFEGWTLENDPKRIRDRAEMLARVKQELGTELPLDPRAVLQSVIRLLVKHVSEGEIRDILSTLPRPIATMWNELSGADTETIAQSTGEPADPAAVRRTGYAR